MPKPPIRNTKGQPEFMAILGLLPPYTLDDVKAAYRVKAMEAHPDRGGAAADFLQINEAYERAVEYLQLTGDRRGWIADHVDCHLRQQEVVVEAARLGGRAEFEEVDWLKRSYADFALLADRLRVIRLTDSAADDAFLTFLAGQPPRAPYLVELHLAGSRVTDKGLRALVGFDLLRGLDLSGTKVTGQGIRAAVESLPALEWVGVAGLGIGWLSRWRLRRSLRGRRADERRLKLSIPGG